ncbi:hypothetical protein CSKR_106473 [Clonorchis sinensis]|uniref:Uncharacterized protein n=1 Tax=Clonorchis sinensis TaxID=79923 RepID=A0A3R7EPL3_CLOSI|nr:hypothetical protein CSKR_106473 [Clonorchis sinensis]
MYIRNTLVTRLLKIPRQPTSGFALLGAHQVGALPEFPSTLFSTVAVIKLPAALVGLFLVHTHN